MKRNSEGGIDLSHGEVRSLAHVLVERAIEDAMEDGWETVPELSEGSWKAVQAQMGRMRMQHQFTAGARGAKVWMEVT